MNENLDKVKKDPFFVQTLSVAEITAEIKNIAIHQQPYSIYYIPKELRTPEDNLYVVQQRGVLIRYLSDEEKTTPVMKAAVKQDWTSIRYIPKEKRNEEIVEIAVKQNKKAKLYTEN